MQFKYGNRSKASIASQRAKAARGRAIRAELAALEAQVIKEGLLPSNWRDAYRIWRGCLYLGFISRISVLGPL